MTTPIDISASSPGGSPRSVATDSTGSPITLDLSTLAILDQFNRERDEAERAFQALSEKAQARLDRQARGEEEEEEEEAMIDVDTFRRAYGEDWQLSQFWYSTPFATELAKWVYALCEPTTTVAFISCPTAYVAFQHTNPLPNTKLLEFDRRFANLDSKAFIHYDLDDPENLPKEFVDAKVDIVVADPPFLNEATNRKLAKTLKLILKPEGKLMLLTSTSVSHILPSIYDTPPLGPLHWSGLKVTHANNLANDFKCWSSWKVEGVEEGGETCLPPPSDEH
ncbi:N(6)-adenine-specific DNA methyltransferase [Pseudohyphozyma bogoriensis]|nr:N(6)-adenine-specific DNA methyltransferase [Pseudohyphozyma bogoriensis]